MRHCVSYLFRTIVAHFVAAMSVEDELIRINYLLFLYSLCYGEDFGHVRTDTLLPTS